MRLLHDGTHYEHIWGGTPKVSDVPHGTEQVLHVVSRASDLPRLIAAASKVFASSTLRSTYFAPRIPNEDTFLGIVSNSDRTRENTGDRPGGSHYHAVVARFTRVREASSVRAMSAKEDNKDTPVTTRRRLAPSTKRNGRLCSPNTAVSTPLHAPLSTRLDKISCL